MKDRLQGKIAVITGGSSGMGLASAELFIAEGASVVIADIRRERGEAAVARLGDQARFVQCDVANEADIAAAIAVAVEAFGGLDIMFNNAGLAGTAAQIEDMTVEGWDSTLAVMVRGPMLGIKHAVPAMRARGGGAIMVTASTAGVRGGMGTAAYAVAKAAAIQLVRMAAAQLAKDNIRVNAICPGFIATPIFGRAMGAADAVADRMLPQLAEKFSALQPLPRAGSPGDIAQGALFLASDAAAFVTGIELVIDGGMLVATTANTTDPGSSSIAAMLMAAHDAAVAG